MGTSSMAALVFQRMARLKFRSICPLESPPTTDLMPPLTTRPIAAGILETRSMAGLNQTPEYGRSGRRLTGSRWETTPDEH